jgi:cell division protein FtsB
MEWIVYGIWFGCGFLCRQIIWQEQKRRARKALDEMDKEIQPKLIEMEKLHKQLKEKLNGDNKHSK